MCNSLIMYVNCIALYATAFLFKDRKKIYIDFRK